MSTNPDTPLTNEASFGWMYCEDGGKYVDDYFAQKLERRLNAGIKIIKDKLAEKRLRPSESATLYEIFVQLEQRPFMEEDAGVIQHRRVHPEEC